MLIKFLNRESGATLVEYGVALILAIVVGGGGMASLASQSSENFSGAETEMNCWEDDTCAN